jgi:hypothetical protein
MALAMRIVLPVWRIYDTVALYVFFAQHISGMCITRLP